MTEYREPISARGYTSAPCIPRPFPARSSLPPTRPWWRRAAARARPPYRRRGSSDSPHIP